MENNIPIHIEYFPAISTMRRITQENTILIEAAETFQKNSLRNRCYIASPSGPLLMSIPLKKGKNAKMPIKEVKIAYDFNWRAVHIKSIKNYYLRSPFFEYYYPVIEQILSKKNIYLIDLTWDTIHFLYTSFKLESMISYSLEFDPYTKKDEVFIDQKPYPQVFENKTGFIKGLSALDLLFCMGPDTKYIMP